MSDNDDIRIMLARIEQGQADLNHELIRLRADIAMSTNRQNIKISDTKKKPIVSAGLSGRLPTVYTN